jgi:hypothetical protein
MKYARLPLNTYMVPSSILNYFNSMLQALLNGEEVVVAIKESIDGVLQNQQYSEHKVSQWTSKCIETCMKRLASQNKPYKYVVTCMIAQKNGESRCTTLELLAQLAFHPQHCVATNRLKLWLAVSILYIGT